MLRTGNELKWKSISYLLFMVRKANFPPPLKNRTELRRTWNIKDTEALCRFLRAHMQSKRFLATYMHCIRFWAAYLYLNRSVTESMNVFSRKKTTQNKKKTDHHRVPRWWPNEGLVAVIVRVPLIYLFILFFFSIFVFCYFFMAAPALGNNRGVSNERVGSEENKWRTPWASRPMGKRGRVWRTSPKKNLKKKKQGTKIKRLPMADLFNKNKNKTPTKKRSSLRKRLIMRAYGDFQ